MEAFTQYLNNKEEMDRSFKNLKENYINKYVNQDEFQKEILEDRYENKE